MASIFVDREVAVCREITKIHEELVKGPIAEVFESLKKPRGEYTIVVAPCPHEGIQPKEAPRGKALWAEFCRLTEQLGLSRRDAVREIAKSSGLKARDVYSAVEAEKNIGQ
jgi:16S rRNA (cytidine1402-2'-O)-methyltransferase